MKILEDELSKFINNCPRCGGELKPYTPLPGLSPVVAYCPSCDILRESHSSIPVLCKNCNSTKFYNRDREKASEIDGMVVEKSVKLYDKNSIFTKKWTYRKDLGEEEINNLLEEIKKLQGQRPEDICWYCGGTEFITLKTDKLFEMEKKGELKIGYKISRNFSPLVHNCKNIQSPDFIERVAKTTYKAVCQCGYEEYVLIPLWQQEEIKEIKLLKGEDDNLDKIMMEDLEMVQKIPIITFTDDEDLFKKVEKAVSRFENT